MKGKEGATAPKQKEKFVEGYKKSKVIPQVVNYHTDVKNVLKAKTLLVGSSSRQKSFGFTPQYWYKYSVIFINPSFPDQFTK